MGDRETITDACAWILWAQAWITLQEETPDGVHPGPGGSWDPYVPAVPDAVKRGAARLIASVERLNGAPIEALYRRACGDAGAGGDRTPDRFGTCLGFQAAGAGVGLADDFPEGDAVKVSEIEISAYSDEGADVGGVDERFA